MTNAGLRGVNKIGLNGMENSFSAEHSRQAPSSTGRCSKIRNLRHPDCKATSRYLKRAQLPHTCGPVKFHSLHTPYLVSHIPTVSLPTLIGFANWPSRISSSIRGCPTSRKRKWWSYSTMLRPKSGTTPSLRSSKTKSLLPSAMRRASATSASNRGRLATKVKAPEQ